MTHCIASCRGAWPCAPAKSERIRCRIQGRERL